jgi:hypothetical protein
MSSSTLVPFKFLTSEELEKNFYDNIVQKLLDKHVKEKKALQDEAKKNEATQDEALLTESEAKKNEATQDEALLESKSSSAEAEYESASASASAQDDPYPWLKYESSSSSSSSAEAEYESSPVEFSQNEAVQGEVTPDEARQKLDKTMEDLPEPRRSQVMAIRDDINCLKDYPIEDEIKAKIITALLEDFEAAIDASYSLLWRLLITSPKNSVAYVGIRPAIGETKDNVYDKVSSKAAHEELNHYRADKKSLIMQKPSRELDEHKKSNDVLLAEIKTNTKKSFWDAKSDQRSLFRSSVIPELKKGVINEETHQLQPSSFRRK